VFASGIFCWKHLPLARAKGRSYDSRSSGGIHLPQIFYVALSMLWMFMGYKQRSLGEKIRAKIKKIL